MKPLLATLLRESSALVGLGLVVYGCWLVYPPASYLAAGTILIADRFATLHNRKGQP